MANIWRQASVVFGMILLVIGMSLMVYSTLRLRRISIRRSNTASTSPGRNSAPRLSRSLSESDLPVAARPPPARRHSTRSKNSLDSDSTSLGNSRASLEDIKLHVQVPSRTYENMNKVTRNMKAIKDVSVKPTQKNLDDLGDILQDLADDKNLMRVKYEFNKREGGSINQDSVDILRNNEETIKIKQIRDTLFDRMNTK